ncbi:MAG: AAA family ATPase [Aquabacterium sp.]|jgi:aminoglycoside phosphotransferase family enzyme/predicted kinase|uniref:bifunctional aminoglycoside phosphotransferase/ATP-binding protein n=1 Tax=Aquabacterium sp. TaxID=1872578 RepID=UPI002A371286|nr:AAA family ATPase [Aquabacterium sp.]MDX9845088.1 AAA family ATPase [Aquabacterium sp.]
MTPSSAAPPDTTLIDRLCQQRQARLIETHISWVLLDGHEAWKIKKPLHLPFLDASTLPLRQQLCDEELRLNRRLAPSLYLEVTPITGTPGAPVLGGSGPVIDYAVHMRQFPDGALLSVLVTSHREPVEVQPATSPSTISPAPSRSPLPEQLNDFAQRLAAFHREADVASASTPYGSPQLVEQTTRDVLRNLADIGDEVLSAPFTRWLDDNAPQLRPLWAQRQAQGRIVEGHGDLHLANVVLLDGTLTAFDCIEFDPGLRWGDPLSDVAFLVMDLMAHQCADLAFRFLNAYLDASGDHAGLPVLRHYLVYRALVRALVARIKAGKGQAPVGPDYLALAHSLIAPTSPRLLITHGVSGSGKTYLTQGLLAHAGAVRLRSDVERKRLFGSSPQLYSAERTQATYTHLCDLAQLSLQAGWHTIVDATFLDGEERERFRHLASSHCAPFAILHCEAPHATLEARVTARQQAAQDASDANVAVLAQQLQRDTALNPEESPHTLQADTTQPDWAQRLAHQWLTLDTRML